MNVEPSSSPIPAGAPVVVDTTPVPQEAAEVHQQPTGPLAILVRHDGPIQSHELPARCGAHSLDVVPTTGAPGGAQPVQISGRDMRRKRLVIISTDKPFYFGDTMSGVQQGKISIWPANVPLVVLHSDAIWVLCASTNTADVATISSFTENWAD